MEEFLASSNWIDWQDARVYAQAEALANDAPNTLDIARRCYDFVRDEIRHSYDFKMNPVTCRASDVLAHRTGYCYAKSHLLAALLRANGIPAALCYQRLSIDDTGPPFSLHGLNAIYLDKHGWYRVDARGNKPGVNAAFTPPIEKLAFSLTLPGEVELEGRWAEPRAEVVECLTNSATWDEVYTRLPDISIGEFIS